MSASVHFSSATPEWATPQDFFDRVAAEFGPFDLDPCATKENAKCARYFTKEQDGLAQAWTGRVWMNPPYGRQIGKWMRKAYESSLRGATVACLVPARTDTAWWHDYAAKGQVRFIRGRLKFGGCASVRAVPQRTRNLQAMKRLPLLFGLTASLLTLAALVGILLDRRDERAMRTAAGESEAERTRR